MPYLVLLGVPNTAPLLKQHASSVNSSVDIQESRPTGRVAPVIKLRRRVRIKQEADVDRLEAERRVQL